MPTFEDIQTEIQNMLDIADDLTPEQQQHMEDYLRELGLQESEKVDRFAWFVMEQAGKAKTCKEAADHLAKKAKTIENRVSWLKARYAEIMRQHGLKKVSGSLYSLSARPSQAVLVNDVNSLPEAYKSLKTEISANKIAIKEALLSGTEIPGCELITRASLQIR